MTRLMNYKLLMKCGLEKPLHFSAMKSGLGKPAKFSPHH